MSNPQGDHGDSPVTAEGTPSGAGAPRTGGGGHSYGGREGRGGQSDWGGGPGDATDQNGTSRPNAAVMGRGDAPGGPPSNDVPEKPEAGGTPAAGAGGEGVYGGMSPAKGHAEHSDRVAEDLPDAPPADQGGVGSTPDSEYRKVHGAVSDLDETNGPGG